MADLKKGDLTPPPPHPQRRKMSNFQISRQKKKEKSVRPLTTTIGFTDQICEFVIRIHLLCI